MRPLREILKEDEAKEGEGPVMWHVSRHARISGGQFHPLTHFGEKDTVRSRAQDVQTKSVHAVRIKHGNSFQTDDVGKHSPHALLNHLHKKGMFNDQEHQQHTNELNRISNNRVGYAKKNPNLTSKGREANSYLAHAIRNKGYHSLHYKNDVEGGTSHIITHPSQVRVIKSRSNSKELNLKPGNEKPRAAPEYNPNHVKDNAYYNSPEYKQHQKEVSHLPFKQSGSIIAKKKKEWDKNNG